MKVTLCDLKDGKEPCGERALITASFIMEKERYEFDACERHAKEMITNAREAESPAPTLPQGYSTRTHIPRATGRITTPQLVDKADYSDLRAWAESQGLLKQGSRGRIKEDVQQAWLDADSPRQVADGTFKSSK